MFGKKGLGVLSSGLMCVSRLDTSHVVSWACCSSLTLPHAMGHVSWSRELIKFDHYRCPCSCDCWKRNWKSEVGGGNLDGCRIWTVQLMRIFRVWSGDAPRQASFWIFLSWWIRSCGSGAWYLDDLTCWKPRDVNHFSWRLEVWTGDVLVSSPFINKLDSWEQIRLSSENFCFQTLALVGWDVIHLIHLVEERKRADEGGCCSPDAHESSCRKMSVFAMGSLGNISFCDETRL